MGQKAILNSLRLINKNKNFNLVHENSKLQIQILRFIDLFRYLAFKRGILLLKTEISVFANTLYVNLHIFFKLQKIFFFKRRLKKKRRHFFASFLLKKNIFEIFNRYFRQTFNTTVSIVKIKNLNLCTNLQFVKFFSYNLKKYRTSLFTRRYRLWIDFLKLTSLFCLRLVDNHSLLQILGEILKTIPKRLHNRYLVFLRTFFHLLLEKKRIEGFKFIINGKFQGKTRAKSKYLQAGKLPLQSLSKDSVFSKLHVYTILGAFGLKLWIYYY